MKQIQKDIDKLGYRESDYRVSTVDAFQSPITFLYQEFSRRERSKRLVAQLENEDRKRALLQGTAAEVCAVRHHQPEP